MGLRNAVDLDKLPGTLSDLSYHDVPTTGRSTALQSTHSALHSTGLDTPYSQQHPAVWPVTGRIPRSSRTSAAPSDLFGGTHRAQGSGVISFSDYVAGMVHAVRATLPLCAPNEATGVGGVPYFNRAAHQGSQYEPGHSGVGVGSTCPVPNDQLLTTERVSYAAEFQLPSGLSIKTFAPAVFMRMLQWTGGTPEGFLEDWCNALLDLGGEESKGKSRATFVHSAERRYIIKTLNYGEFTTLRNVLPSYYTHLLHSPNSLLNHHLGAFRISRGREQRYFTVLLNLLPATVSFSTIYDLKGSTFKRAASAADKTANPPLLKDNDFLDAAERLSIGVIDQHILLAQLETDVAWLQRHNVMDYSFLVGKVASPGGEPGASTSPPSFRSAGDDRDGAAPSLTQTGGHTAIRNAHSQVAFYVGIIDFLQDFNMTKKLAHTLKTTVGGAEKDALSTIPAEDYGNRFMSFMSKSFANQRRTTSSFFLDPYQAASKQQSRLHRDDAIAVGDVVGRTFNEALTLDVMSPNVRSLCVVSEVRIPKTHSNAALIEQSCVSLMEVMSRGESAAGAPLTAAVAAAVAQRSNSHSPACEPASPARASQRHSSIGPLFEQQSVMSESAVSQSLSDRLSVTTKSLNPTERSHPPNLSPRDAEHPAPAAVRVPTCDRGSTDDHDEADDRLLLYICHTGSNVPVNVKGPVDRGDMLIPSGLSDGTAVAVPRSCPVPPYCFGVVESVPPSVPEPNAAATKYTVVRAAVGEPLMVDPHVRWQKMLMVPLHTTVDTTQAMWVDATEEERTMLTRSAILNPFGTSLIKGSWASGVGWLVVDWMCGAIVHGGCSTHIPIRSADGVIYEYMAREMQRRRQKMVTYLESYIDQGLQVNILKNLPAMEGMQWMQPASSMTTSEAGGASTGAPTCVTPRSAAVVARSNRSLANLLRDWFGEPKEAAQQRAQQLARQRYKANQLCTVSALCKTKGLFRKVLCFLALPDLNTVSRVCVQWNRQYYSAELWAHVLLLYEIQDEDGYGCTSPDAMKAFYLHHLPRRALTFGIGEVWEEVFGLRYPLYGTSKRRLLALNTQLDLYDLIFQKHMPPNRSVLDFGLFRRDQYIGGDVTSPAHTADIARTVHAFWPQLRNQWLRSSLTLKFEALCEEQSTQDLAVMRLMAERWLGNAPAKLSWEGKALLATFPSLDVVEGLLARYETEAARVGECGLCFTVTRYAVMELCRKVVPWREARKRIWQAFPGASLKPANKAAIPFPPKVQEEYGAGCDEAGELRHRLARCFERHLFPPELGGSVGGVPDPSGDAEPGTRYVEVFEIEGPHAVRLPGQVFPHFVVGAKGVVGLMEANSRLPVLTAETAAQHPLGHVCIDTHSGLEVHVVCAMAQVKCTEETMEKLLLALDTIVHGQGTARSTYSIAVDGQGMPDGTLYVSPIWVTEGLRDFQDDIFDVLRGRKESLEVLRERERELLLRCFTQDITSIPGFALGTPLASPTGAGHTLRQRQASQVSASNASVATIRRMPPSYDELYKNTDSFNDSLHRSVSHSGFESPPPSQTSLYIPTPERDAVRQSPVFSGPVSYAPE
eukprot:TRINITY_DN20356_c0_g1_i1.p1 TRINITY_DN20356_c0_g1~~TRINITY_DN20356_c0_g1_i1.p1  ORF type:complete len:1570 (+),score=520.97 TRINITY_DN20356_c0_g1_i1:58-4767(+)